MIMLKLVSSHPEFFGFSGRSAVKRGEGIGCNCAKCGREISAPFGYETELVWCLYCGMEAGFVPVVEHIYSHAHTFGVTREECIEDRKAIEQGSEAFERMSERRARRNGQIIDFWRLF